jgi:hypothetical protein
MQKSVLTDVAVVVRASGERTMEACIQLLEEQAGPLAGLVQYVSPFNLASIKSVEIAVATGKKYTALVDADVLISPGSLSKLRSILENASPETFLVNTYTLDKFHLAGREGGIHFYRTELLANYLNLANEWGNIARPEAKFHHWMEANGFRIHYDSSITSIHEFFQWRKDVRQKVGFRLKKLGINQLKHARYLKRMGWLDVDFKIAGSLIHDDKTSLVNERPYSFKAMPNEKMASILFWKIRFMVQPWAIYCYIYLQIPLKRLLG